jgi:hypothetical protein
MAQNIKQQEELNLWKQFNEEYEGKVDLSTEIWNIVRKREYSMLTSEGKNLGTKSICFHSVTKQ